MEWPLSIKDSLHIVSHDPETDMLSELGTFKPDFEG